MRIIRGQSKEVRGSTVDEKGRHAPCQLFLEKKYKERGWIMPPVCDTLGSDFDLFNVTVLQCLVKQTTPRCCRFVFIIGEKIKPTLTLSLIFPSVAVDFISAVKCYQQVVSVAVGDDLKVSNGAAVDCGADRKVGGSGHDASVVDLLILQHGRGHRCPPLCILTIRHNGINCFLCSPM